MSTGDPHSRSKGDPSPGRIAIMGTLGVVLGAAAMAGVGFAFTSAFEGSPREAASVARTASAAGPPPTSAIPTGAGATPEASATTTGDIAAETAEPTVAPPPATTLTGSLSSLVPPTAPASSEKHDALDPYATAQPSDAPLAKDVYDGI